MNFAGRDRPRTYANARPAGESDDDISDSDDGMMYNGSTTRKKKINSYVPISNRNGEASVCQNGDSAGVEAGGWGDAEDWETNGGQSQSSKENEWGRSPAEAVRRACQRGDLDKLKELLSGPYSAGINQFFKGGEENPLIVACSQGQIHIVEYLIKEKKANPNLKHPTPKTTALMALAGCFTDEEDENAILKGVIALIDAGANVNLQDRYGMTALMIAVQRKRTLVAKYLLEQKADPNLADPDGQTALIFAAMEGDGRLCRLLLEHEAHVELVNRSGFTAADLAQDKSNFELANLLYLVKETKWRPGLNPNLMQEVAEQSPQKDKFRQDTYSVKEDSSMELLLGAVDGLKYLEKFKKHKITYVQFLHVTEEQLKEIGVDEVGVREKILDHVKQIQNAQWENSSIRLVATNKNVTASEALCMIVNTNEHLEYMSSGLKYLHSRITQKPLALRYDVERSKIEDLMKFCEQTEAHCCQFRENVVELYKLVGKLQGYTELQIAGKLPKRSFDDFKQLKGSRSSRKLVVGFAMVSVGLGVYGIFKGWLSLNWVQRK